MDNRMVGNLEQRVASRLAGPRFGNRLPGWSGVTLPGSGQNVVGVPRTIRRNRAGGSVPNNELDKVRKLIGRPRPSNGWSYF